MAIALKYKFVHMKTVSLEKKQTFNKYQTAKQ